MPKTIDEYLALGLDRKSAEYFSRGRKRILSVKANEDYSLTLTFDNGEQRVLDLRPLLQPGTVFEALLDRSVFDRVFLDEARAVCWDIDETVDSSVVWNNRIDLCPDSCYMDSKPLEEADPA